MVLTKEEKLLLMETTLENLKLGGDLIIWYRMVKDMKIVLFSEIIKKTLWVT
jgi:hypothetical protein